MPPRQQPVQAPPASKASSQVLPPKDQAVFKQILKLYETKKYPRALKLADQILKKYKEHGETLAMKGLILSNLKKKDEAEKLIKQGLQLNMKSHVCWHVYGLLHRSNHDYDQAIRCYTQAVKIDPDNLQILKDLSLLQIQRRNHEGFKETRRKILVLKASNKQNWLAYAIGSHLSGDYKKAIEILDAYHKANNQERRTGVVAVGQQAYEDSELLLYKNLVLEESGQIAKALEHLDESEGDVVDKLYWREKRAHLLLKVGKPAEAEKEYRALLEINPESYRYHQHLQMCLGLDGTVSEEKTKKLVAVYDELAKEYPKSTTIVRLPFDFIPGTSPVFKKRMDSYLRQYIRKGIPSLFRDIRPLYVDPSKAGVIWGLIHDYLTNLRDQLRFGPDQKPDSEVPSALLFALMLAAEHHNHLRRYSEALKFIDEAIAHTPTNLDLYLLKARIYKHAGDFPSAFEFIDQARKLDTADRYLNTKTVRYALRADNLESAQRIVAMFLRDGDAMTNLYDMQAMWYELNLADSFLRQKDYGQALRKLHAVDEHFETIFEDQFDFHTYCLRKMTLRTYIEMLRWQDRLQSHRFYFRAARNLVKTYLLLNDNPLLAQDKGKAGEAPGDTKQAIRAQRRKAARASHNASEENSSEADRHDRDTKTFGHTIAGKKGDEDPYGVKLLQTKDPLAMATKFLKQLLLYRPDEIDTQLAAIQVYMRKKKYLLVAKALKQAHKIQPSNAQLFTDKIAFLLAVDDSTDLDEKVKEVLDAERKAVALGEGKSGKQILTLFDSFLKTHAGSLPHSLAAAKAYLNLASSKTFAGQDLKDRGVKLLTSVPLTDYRISPTHEEARSAYEFLVQNAPSSAHIMFKHQATAKFPLTPFFQDEKSKGAKKDDEKKEPKVEGSDDEEDGQKEKKEEKKGSKKKGSKKEDENKEEGGAKEEGGSKKKGSKKDENKEEGGAKEEGGSKKEGSKGKKEGGAKKREGSESKEGKKPTSKEKEADGEEDGAEKPEATAEKPEATAEKEKGSKKKVVKKSAKKT